MGFKKNQFLVSENYAKSSLSIPIYFDLKEIEFQKVIKVIKNIFYSLDLEKNIKTLIF